MAREDFIYTSCYCEENVYLLMKQIHNTDVDDSLDIYATFISNFKKTVALWRQGKGNPVIWDYHVICIVYDRINHKYLVYDLDSQINFPCSLSEYMEATFAPLESFPEHVQDEYRSLFRVINFKDFMIYFGSDRSHMLKENSTDEYISPPPNYPKIGEHMTLMKYIDMRIVDDKKLGKIYDFEAMTTTGGGTEPFLCGMENKMNL